MLWFLLLAINPVQTRGQLILPQPPPRPTYCAGGFQLHHLPAHTLRGTYHRPDLQDKSRRDKETVSALCEDSNSHPRFLTPSLPHPKLKPTWRVLQNLQNYRDSVGPAGEAACQSADRHTRDRVHVTHTRPQEARPPLLSVLPLQPGQPWRRWQDGQQNSPSVSHLTTHETQ